MNDYYSFTTEYGMKDELFKAVLSLDKPLFEQLKKQGVTLTEDVKRTLINGGGPMVSNKPAAPFWYLYLTDLGYIGKEDFVWISRAFFAETNAPLYYSDSLGQAISNYFFDKEVFACLFECYDLKKLNKTRTLKEIIDKGNVELLSLCVENGWLKMPRKRDEMIQYASEKGKTECAAWLLDFKNRTADLAAERAKAEKKAERELNADPNSVTELKKVWGYESLGDADTMSAQDRQQSDLGGTLMITRYKGDRTEIELPAKIGKNAVTAIGEYAFSPEASRITTTQRSFRRTITKVKLPDSIQSIGTAAFQSCWAMSELNIPESAAEIGDNALCGCRMVTEFVIPESVKKMGKGVFAGCIALRRVKLPESTAEIGDFMFANCTALEKITIPAAVVRIGQWAFNRCSSLEEIVIPEGVEEIDKQAFMNCGSLKTVVLPASIKSIKNYKYRNHAPETIFHDSPNVTAVVEQGSYAEKYCKKNEIKFVYNTEH